MTIEELIKRGKPFTNDEVAMLVDFIGDMDDDHCFEEDGDCWRDDVLDKYAEYIQNYIYNYKPEAKHIDPSIDPDEEHIGPMAQDIEKVNPACIKETPNGIKTVDTGRLALMNAGAIADLARRLDDLERRM